MHKIKILFISHKFDAGGSERVILELARGLNPQQFEIYVASFGDGILDSSFKKVCKKFFLINKSRRLNIYMMLQIAEIVRNNHIDVVNAHHYMPCLYSFFGTRILNQKKIVYTEHSVPEVKEVAACFHRKVLNLMLFRLNKVIGVSDEITRKFAKYYPRHANKFMTILNGVDIENFKVNAARELVRERWGFSSEHFVVGTVANFRKVKNHACLIRAVGRLKNSHPQLRLFFVGTGFEGDLENSENMVRVLIRELELQDRVVLAGYQENIPEILSAFDAFCLPSFSEGLPVSVLEAMAAEVPVVGSNVRGINEVVQDRETGLLFVSDDDSNLASALNEILLSPTLAQNLAARASEYVKANHGKQVWIKKTSDVFCNA